MNLLVIFLPTLFCLTALGATGYIVSTYAQSVQAAPEPASLATEGNAETKTLNQDPEKRQRELNRVVGEGMLAFSVSATPFTKNGASTANPLIENPPGNGKRFIITVRRNGTGEVIYQFDYLDPEQYIDDVPLGVVLPKGEYAHTAHFDAYRIDNNAYIGGAGAEVKLYVLE